MSHNSGSKHENWLIIDAFCTIFHGEAEFGNISKSCKFQKVVSGRVCEGTIQRFPWLFHGILGYFFSKITQIINIIFNINHTIERYVYILLWPDTHDRAPPVILLAQVAAQVKCTLCLFVLESLI